VAGALVFAENAAIASPATTSTEQGYELGEVQHPRTVGMAGANQVFGGSTSAIFANPANLSLYRVYHLEGLAAFSPEARRQSYGGAVVDSSTSRVAGGFGGTWSQMDPDGIKRQWTDLRLTLAYPLGDRFHIGATGRYLRAQQGTQRGPFGASPASDGTPNDPLTNQFTFDAGIAIAVTDQLRVAVSGRNLTAPGTGLMPTAIAGGIGWSNQTVTAEANTLVDFTTFGSARARAMARCKRNTPCCRRRWPSSSPMPGRASKPHSPTATMSASLSRRALRAAKASSTARSSRCGSSCGCRPTA